MELDRALKVVEEVLFTQQNRHLSDPEMTILRGTWQGMTYDEMALNSQYSVNYLMRDVGPNFWRSLSEILGERVSKSNCRTVLERYQMRTKPVRDASPENKHSLLIPPSPQHQNWGEAPDISLFYGRLRELKTLDRWVIKEQSRLVCLWGMGGMGKTTLSRQFVENVKDRFDYLFWRSLRNMPPIVELLAEMLSLFSPRETLQNHSDRGISQVLEYLQKYRCLIIFDDVEAILQSGGLGHYALGYEAYGQFFKRVGETQHQSCLLLNSQEKLREIILLENSTKFVHSLELPGLRLDEARELFKDKNLTGEKTWSDFVDLYQGNPLALNLTIITIQNFFNGDVSQYIRLKTTYLPTEIANILQERCDKISSLEIAILTHLAKTSQSLSLLEIKEKLSPQLEVSDAMVAIESLKRRSLIVIKTHEQGTSFILQPVVKKYVTKHYLSSSHKNNE
ncbi:NB-ARC domain-containing protein [Spirulina sp. 06S082]|uniref:NB-ARC domain-containing protein n=1 Tax=Spirulina sp. 06S082 TaxID=3110248 RepID=UPI002B21DE7D|nr:NB-ARC domain-containing protein [Spirulina sp. 06S082]MEA5468423.1 NB-ARC domain-containing protein [Spirulina sp. 06S082]